MPANLPDQTFDDVANLAEKPRALAAGFMVHLDDQPIEGGFDPEVGDVTWQTLISGDRTDSTDLILGVATFLPHGVLNLHRHTPPEFYFCLAGSGTVTMDGAHYPLVPGATVFIPGDVEHGVVAGPEGLKFAYGFGENAFSEIAYRFSA